MHITRRSLLGAAAAAWSLPVRAQNPIIRIGVLTDMSGPYRDLGGPLCVACAQQAADEFKAENRGFRVEILAADHLNKADVGSAIAREWFDQQAVDAIADINNSAVALALAPLCVAKDKAQLNTGAALADLTGKACTPNLIHWTYDTWEQGHSTCESMVRAGGDTWFFITADYAFGHAMERDARRFVQDAGGRVLGSVTYPFPATTDFSSFLIQAQASGAISKGWTQSRISTTALSPSRSRHFAWPKTKPSSIPAPRSPTSPARTARRT
ncbi:MAG: ABC transporter substrate-binding protein [Acetobacteraceae bacterium]|nr:ABC transporter substrate-binding protein [Acetobacteraceae bacterium]